MSHSLVTLRRSCRVTELGWSLRLHPCCYKLTEIVELIFLMHGCPCLHVLSFIHVVVKFYPWFKFFPLFQNIIITISKNKEICKKINKI